MTDPRVTVTESQAVQVGDHNVQHNTIVSVTPAAVEAVVHNLPPATGVFVGRDLAVIPETTTVLHGLGGIGKSELAIQHARRYLDRVAWWITADSPANIELGLAELTRRLHPVATLADAHAWAVSWLQAHTGWLLVLDNVEDIEHIRPLLGQVAANGRVLMTTRRDLGTARWRQLGVHPVRLGPLDRAASVELLVELTGQDDRDGAARLAQDLGDLPLALDQAAAYIAQHHAMTFDTYRAKLATKFTKVADAIARIWQVTLDTIQDPLASTVLSVLGWLAPDGLPIDVLEPLGEDVDDAVALLVSYNMISISENAISVHRLVQAVTRTDDTRAVATGLLLDAIPENPENLAVPDMLRWNRLLPHIDALLSHGHIDQDVLYLTDQAATFRAFHGQNATAIAMLERLVENSRRLNGEDHLSIAGAWLRLGIACWTAGRNTDAVAPFEQGAQACRRILGDDHPDTLTVRHHLAYAYRAAGRVQEARAQFEALYADSRRLLGVDDRDTKLIAEELKTVRGVR